ncbi:PAS domain S-box protein [Halorarius litoreus]|uniref:PAS domain S-box protein n=1 Tax=Halorarius litoreus TaxID=2962676 RepID=UPI0020CCFB1D|nr:PAS domain S-box protein [Halorarius litoreus]
MTNTSLTGALRETLAVFADAPPGQPLTTTEVAAALDLGRRSSYDRLERLAEGGHLETKSVGARGRVWWQPVEPDRRDRDAGGVDQTFQSLVAAVEEYAIFVLDADGYVETWNPGAAHIKGYERAEVVGQHVSTFYTDDDVADGVPERLLGEAAESGSVETEGWRVRKDGTRFWASVTLTALYDDDGDLTGYAKVTRDETDRRTFEQLLKHQRDELKAELDELFDRLSEGFFRLDEADRVTYVNDQAAELLGVDRTALEGEPLDAFDGFDTTFAELTDYDGNGGGELEFETYHEPHDTWLHVTAYPGRQGISVYFTHISERKQRQRELERYETIVETISDGVYVVDDTTGRFTMVNDAYAAMTGYSKSELVGSHVSIVVDDETIETAQRNRDELLAGERETGRVVADLQTASGGSVPSEATFTLLSDPRADEPAERVAVVRNMSERIQRERELERYETIVETVDDGIYIVDTDYNFQLVNEAYERLTGRSREELLGSHISTVVDSDTVDLGTELREELERGMGSGGELELEMTAADGEVRTVEIKYAPLESDGEFLGTTGIIRDVTDRKAYEQELERRRRKLVALDDLNTVAREITATVITQSTRDEIERRLCSHLAASNSYDAAWVGGIDGPNGSVSYHAMAGVDGAVDADVEPTSPDYEAVVTQAVETQEMQVVTDLLDWGPSRPVAACDAPDEAYTAAIIPIAHEGTVYGLLHVYAARQGAFTGEERTVLSQLGGVVGHAVAAVDQKRALMSDELVELEFSTTDYQRAFGMAYDGDGQVTLTRTVPMGEDAYLVYGTVNDDGIDLLTTLAESLPHWADYDVLDTTGDSTKVQVRLNGPPTLAAVAAHGGRVDEIVFEADQASMRAHLAPTTPVREIIDMVRETYPTTKLVARRQIAQPVDGPSNVQQVVLESLTDRQRTVIDVAYNSGFFESPRLSSGEDVADTLDITPSTFHQHLRKAEEKLVEAVLETAV